MKTTKQIEVIRFIASPRSVQELGVAILLAFAAVSALAADQSAQTSSGACAVPTAREMLGPSPIVPVSEEPAASIIVDPPLPDQLANGRLVIQYRTENLRVMPVFGAAAVAVSPRIGHIHVTLDDAPWVWANTSGEELIFEGLSPGPHKVCLEPANPNHQTLAKQVVNFIVPPKSAAGSDPGAVVNEPITEQPAARIIAGPPQPERLARGVVFIEYRTENLQLAPVFGAAGLAISPRVGHIQVTVDNAPWHWVDSSGGPVIVAHLPPGSHKIEIVLANPLNQPLDRAVAEFVIPNSETKGK